MIAVDLMPRKKSRRTTTELVVLQRDGGVAHRVPLPLRQRHLNFGTKWDYAPAPETSS
jgi:hypothetical protein